MKLRKAERPNRREGERHDRRQDGEIAINLPCRYDRDPPSSQCRATALAARIGGCAIRFLVLFATTVRRSVGRRKQRPARRTQEQAHQGQARQKCQPTALHDLQPKRGVEICQWTPPRISSYSAPSRSRVSPELNFTSTTWASRYFSPFCRIVIAKGVRRPSTSR